MGKRSQRRNAAMLDSDDDGCVSLFSPGRSALLEVSGAEEVHLDQDSLLDRALDALDEKRGSTRENALSFIVEAFSNNMQHQFVEEKFATLLHQCVGSIRKGSKKTSAKEIALASHVIGLLILTTGYGDKASEIFEESIRSLDESLSLGSDVSKISLVESLAVITFVGGNDQEETQRSMDMMWQIINPKLGSNVVTVKPSALLITIVVSAWSFLLSTMDEVKLNTKNWQNYISYFSSLLDKEDRSMRKAAGEALALIFDIGITENLSAETKSASDMVGEESEPRESYAHIHGLKGKVINQVRNLSVEAGGKGSSKKNLNSQKILFRDILEFFEHGHSPEISMKTNGDLLQTSSWTQVIQVNFLKRFLGGGFVKHLQENDLLHDVFNFTPKRRDLSDRVHRMTNCEKRMFKSSNSILSKERTQSLKKQRMLSKVVTVKPSALLITIVVSAWSFLLSTMDEVKLNTKNWQNYISYFSSLLDKEDRSMRKAAGEALALIFDIGITENLSAETKSASDMVGEESEPRESYAHIHGLKGKVINQVRNLSVEAGGKGSSKKNLNSQKILFRDILEFFEHGHSPEISMKTNGDLLQTSSWTQVIQVNFLKRFLGGGFVKHLQENDLLHDVFNFTPKRRDLSDRVHRMTNCEKRMFKSSNSILSKERTQSLKKQRMLSKGRNLAHYAVNMVEEVMSY